MKRESTIRHQNESDNKSKSCELIGKIDVYKLLHGRRVELTLKDGPCFNGGGQLTSNFCFTTRES